VVVRTAMTRSPMGPSLTGPQPSEGDKREFPRCVAGSLRVRAGTSNASLGGNPMVGFHVLQRVEEVNLRTLGPELGKVVARAYHQRQAVILKSSSAWGDKPSTVPEGERACGGGGGMHHLPRGRGPLPGRRHLSALPGPYSTAGHRCWE